MNLQLIIQIVEWFNTYQKKLKKNEALELYWKLIKEEGDKTLAAFKTKDLKEFLDGVANLYWVITIYNYLSWEVNYSLYAICYKFLEETNLKDRKIKAVMDDLLKEVVKSNFTKELSLQTEGEKVGKVIKGENFIPPDISKVIKKYNIKWA